MKLLIYLGTVHPNQESSNPRFLSYEWK